MWNSFKTYDLSPEQAFETMNNQLFERFLYSKYCDKLINFRVINGAGGDGGIEAYGELCDNSILAIQSKWFRNNLEDSQISQIEKSVRTAVGLRPAITTYIICIPRNLNSVKIGKGKKPINNTEEARLNNLNAVLSKDFPKLKITWWFEHEINNELLKPDNEGVHKYWFEKELFFFRSLEDKLLRQKTNSWLRERYVPNLNGSGMIQAQIGRQVYARNYREWLLQLTHKTVYEMASFDTLLGQMLQYSEDKPYVGLLHQLAAQISNIHDYLKKIIKAVRNADEPRMPMPDAVEAAEGIIDELRTKLRDTIPTNLQKPYFESFFRKLEILQTDLLADIYTLGNVLDIKACSIIFGRPGTGKTHGFAYGVEHYLNQGCPAVLIRAYGADSSSWASLLTSELELRDWNMNEIFSALETLAHRNDTKRAEAAKSGLAEDLEASKVLICIDGLDEDMANWDSWYDRIAEVGEIVRKYKRIRILFSSRKNFYNNTKIIENSHLHIVDMPREGDVAIAEVLEAYLEEYKITISDIAQVSGLDSLLALKLFCEQYRGWVITETTQVETATVVLLNLKLDRLNDEFLRMLQMQNLQVNPVNDTLLTLSEMFYHTPELSHQQIRETIDKDLEAYLNKAEIEQLLQFLAENGIVTRSEKQEGTGIIKKRIKYYTITYQSILDIVLSEHITHQVISKGVEELPGIVFKNFALPPDVNPIEFRRKHNGKTPNQQLIQNVVNKILIRTGKLVGVDGFLSKGFNKKAIFDMQLEALASVPDEVALLYKGWIDTKIYNNYFQRYKIIKSLIYPLANNPHHTFNAMYLHNILAAFPDVFSRDKFWSGLDDHEKRFGGIDEDWTLADIFRSYRDLGEYESFNGRPLLYAWALTTLDQKLREDIRIKLTKWALVVPSEFLKMLDLLFNCNDPQLKEDLASIMLGLSSRCRDKEAIAALSAWSLKNVFEEKERHRSIIIRHGFRAIVERAYLLKIIKRKDVLLARPAKAKSFTFIPLDLLYLQSPIEEFYPIVHDLAWYVIKDAYDHFLTYNVGYHETGVTKETSSFLSKYVTKYDGKFEMHPRTWTMAAALKYIHSLGFNRKKGSWTTDASHGSKSKVFTYEEKYVWLAVNYIKGYLSDYLPYNDFGNKFWVRDYSEVTEIHNPGDDFDNVLERLFDKQFNTLPWLIREPLTPEIAVNGDLAVTIEQAVNAEPEIAFSNWIKFGKQDFQFLGESGQAIALYNYTSLYNSNATLQSSIELHCCMMKKKDFTVFKNIMLTYFNNDILRDDLQYYARPQTDTYANPSDIVWMNWIGEDGSDIDFIGDITFSTAVAKVFKNSVDGEQEIYIPSKNVRKLLKIERLEDDLYRTKDDTTIGANYKIPTDNFGEYQDILVVHDAKFSNNLSKKGIVRFWFALTIINRNPHNNTLESMPYFQKVRKYLVWEEETSFFSHKFWEGRFINEL